MVNYCVDCGTEISWNAKRCPKCRDKYSRKYSEEEKMATPPLREAKGGTKRGRPKGSFSKKRLAQMAKDGTIGRPKGSKNIKTLKKLTEQEQIKADRLPNLQKLAKLIDTHGVIELRMRMQKNEINPLLTFQFSIVHSDITLMEWLTETYGGHFFLTHNSLEFNYSWYLNRKAGVKLLKEVYLHLISKKIQVKIYLDCSKRIDDKVGYSVGLHGWELSDAEWTRRMSDWEQIVKLNIPRRNNKLQQDFTKFVAQIKKRFIQPILEDSDVSGFYGLQFDDDEWKRLAAQLNLSQNEIAKVLGISNSALSKIFDRLKI